MSLITQCPACATMFKVVPDQLRISDGWVRCGQCDEVFDANAHLQSEEAEALPETEHADAGMPPVPTADAVATPAVQAYDIELPDTTPPLPDVVAAPSSSASGVEPFKIPTEWPAADASFEDPFLERSPKELAQSHDRHRVSEGLLADPFGHAGDTALPRYQQASTPIEGDAKLSFLRAAPASLARPWVRRMLAACSGLLAGVLLLQILVQERDRIAASEPNAVPALTSLCSVLKCKVTPLRQIESVVIDSSSFSKVRAEAYRLNFALKNLAAVGVATPAVELTLTDAQDQAVIRKVFMASDFGAQQEVLASGTELSVSLPVGVRLPAGGERIAGYRLLAFYP